MGRRKVSMGLIPNRRVRVATFAKRKEGLKKKARELATLCGVEVALVVAAADGDGGAGAAAPEPEVWESKGGVLDRYRALDPEVRAGHTHQAYAMVDLGKEEAKLARARQGGPQALAPWDKALDAVATAEEAERLIEAVDTAIRATNERRRALGLPVGDEDGGGGGLLEGIAPLDFVGVNDYLPHAPGGIGDTGDQVMWGNGLQHCSAATMQPAGYDFQQCTSTSGAGMEGYHLQMLPNMYGNSSNNNDGRLARDAFQPRNAGPMQHGYGFQCTGGSYLGMPGYQTQQVQGSSRAQPNLAMWSTDEPRNALVPVDQHPSLDTGLGYMDTPAAHAAQGSGDRSFAMGASGNFINSPPLSLTIGGGGNFINVPPAHSLTMGTGDNFTNATQAPPLAMSYGGHLINTGSYATQWQQPQRAGSSQQSSVEQLHYLSDLEDTQLHYLSDLEDTQLHLWGN